MIALPLLAIAQDAAPSAAAASDATASGASEENLSVIPVHPADDAERPAVSASGSENVQKIDEVVVTATKRSAPLREIPASISSLSAEQLENQGVQGVDDIAKLVPGVNVTTDAGVSRVTIRGISAQTGTNSTTGIAFGNVSFSDAYIPLASLDPNPFDLQSVEVLKGPQGALFGAAALNGLVRYVPEPPKFGEWQAHYFAQYTDLSQGGDGLSYGAAVNVPIGTDDRYALRVMGFDRHAPGYIDNIRLNDEDANRMKQHGARGIFGARPTDNWDIALTYAWQASSIVDALTADNLDGRLSSDNRPQASPQDSSYDIAVASVAYNGFDFAQLISESSFVRKDSHNFGDLSRSAVPGGTVPALGIHLDANSNSYTQELRLVSHDEPDSRWQWVSGLYGSRQNVDQTLSLAVGGASLPLSPAILAQTNGLTNGYGEPVVLIEQPQVVVTEYALFGELTRRLGEDRQWELSAGGRLYRTESSGVNNLAGALELATSGQFNHELSGTVGGHGFSPKLSLTWHATDNILSYVAVSRGFRVGGIQPGVTNPASATQAPEFFKSDSIWNYEGGVRTQWFDKTLQLDVTGFFERWTNPQTIQPDSTGTTNYIDNAGGVQSTGGDLALQYLLPVPGFLLRESLSYAKTVTTEDFKTGSGRVSTPGDPWPFAPRLQDATTLAYLAATESIQYDAGLTYSYTSKAVNNLGELKPVFNFQQWDVYLKLTSVEYRWLPNLTLNVNNVLDERGVTQNVTQGSVQPTQDVGYITPRAVIVRLGGSF